MSFKIDILPPHLAIIRDILSEYLVGVDIYIFGSRATNTAKKYSDLDIALEAQNGKEIQIEVMINLKYAFEESDLPYKVDIIDLTSVDKEFKKIIDKDKIKLDIKRGFT